MIFGFDLIRILKGLIGGIILLDRGGDDQLNHRLNIIGMLGQDILDDFNRLFLVPQRGVDGGKGVFRPGPVRVERDRLIGVIQRQFKLPLGAGSVGHHAQQLRAGRFMVENPVKPLQGLIRLVELGIGLTDRRHDRGIFWHQPGGFFQRINGPDVFFLFNKTLAQRHQQMRMIRVLGDHFFQSFDRYIEISRINNALGHAASAGRIIGVQLQGLIKATPGIGVQFQFQVGFTETAPWISNTGVELGCAFQVDPGLFSLIEQQAGHPEAIEQHEGSGIGGDQALAVTRCLSHLFLFQEINDNLALFCGRIDDRLVAG